MRYLVILFIYSSFSTNCYAEASIDSKESVDIIVAEMTEDVKDLLKQLARQLKKENKDISEFRHVFKQRPVLEINFGLDVDLEDISNGLLVQAVARNSPAEKVGILANDRVMSFDALKVTEFNREKIIEMFGEYQIGQRVELKIERNKEIFEVEVILEGRYLPNIELRIGADDLRQY